jgi:hypothetical protein
MMVLSIGIPLTLFGKNGYCITDLKLFFTVLHCFHNLLLIVSTNSYLTASVHNDEIACPTCV